MSRVRAGIPWVLLSLSWAAPSAADELVVAESTGPTLVVSLKLRGRLTGTAEQVGAVPVDDEGVELDPGLLFTSQVLLGAEADMVLKARVPILFNAAVDGYFYSGQLAGKNDLEGVDLPADQEDALFLKTAFARLSVGPILTVGAGLTSPTWGLGLLANGGIRSNDWEAGTARFADPYMGDTNLRALVATGPWGEPKAVVFGFADQVEEDASLRPGDEAQQAGGGVRVGEAEGRNASLFVVRRVIEAEDGDETDAVAVDLSGSLPIQFDTVRLTLEAEAAFIAGKTDLGPSFDHRVHQLAQFGAAFRGRLHMGKVGFVLDAMYASGDQDLSDGDQNAFKADRNYELGLLLFRYVTAAQTGYAPTTASDPNLIGRPPEDLDRFPTQGGVSNTIAFFPRSYYRPVESVEIYGGPLVAFSQVPLVDPLNTNYNGGRARNAFDGEPGNYLGTELDLGVRARLDLGPVQLLGRVEGGVLLPGSAFNDAEGETPDALFGGRASLELAF